jgi:hypothetical protein
MQASGWSTALQTCKYKVAEGSGPSGAGGLEPGTDDFGSKQASGLEAESASAALTIFEGYVSAFSASSACHWLPRPCNAAAQLLAG